ncbi:MAG: hypothetical protein V1844_00865, partial [Pseudomonadota bacterium]
MDPIVWDGSATSIKFVLESTPEGGELGPEHYELELARLGPGSSYKVEKERTFTTPEEFISDEESLLSITSGPFINNHFIPPFQRALASIAVYHDLHTNKDASVRQPAISRMEKRVDPDGQNLISVMHTLYTGDRDFK